MIILRRTGNVEITKVSVTFTKIYIGSYNRTIMKLSLNYGCEVRTTTRYTERRLRTFENRMWRRISSPIYDRFIAEYERGEESSIGNYRKK